MSWTTLSPLLQDFVLTALAVAALTGLVLLIRKPFARQFGPRTAYALWLLPLVRFVLPPLPPSFSLAGWLGLPPLAEPKLQAVHPLSPTPVTALPEPMARLSIPQSATAAEPLPAPEPGLWASLPDQLLPALLVVWISGTLIWLGRSCYQQAVFRRLVDTDSEPASPVIQAEARRLAQQIELRQIPCIRQSLLCAGPLVTGLTRPVVLLPQWFEEDYSPAEQRDALDHELTHLKRGDLWAFQLARLVAATQWFNPLTYLALYAFRIDQEAACDADVLRRGQVSPAAYGRTLVKAARLAAPADRRLATASLTLAHPIKERLIMLQTPEPSLRQKLTGTALAGALGTLTLFATASCMAAQADGNTPQGQVDVQTISPTDTGPSIILLGDPLNAEIRRRHQGAGEEKQVFIMKSAESLEDFEARIDAWAADMETRAAELEGDAEALDREVEIIALRIERKTEALEADTEARIEAALGPDFENRMEAAAAQIQSLHQKCASRDGDAPDPDIVSVTNEQTGETVRAVCVNGGRDQVMSDGLADWVEGREDLTPAEKQTFLHQRGQTLHFAFAHREEGAGPEGMEKRITIKRRHRIDHAETEEGSDD